MTDTFVIHKNHPTGRSECPSLTQFTQETTIGDIQKYVESSVELSTINFYNYEIHIYNKKYHRCVMLEQRYLDQFKPFQCNDIVSNEQPIVLSGEPCTDYYVTLEVIWSIKKDNNRVGFEQILYHSKQEPLEHHSHDNLQISSNEMEQFSNISEASSMSKIFISTEDDNQMPSFDTYCGVSSMDPRRNKHDSISSTVHDKDLIPTSPTTAELKTPIFSQLLSSSSDKNGPEQCSDVTYRSPELKTPIDSTFDNICPLSTIPKLPENTVDDIHIQMNTPLYSLNVSFIPTELDLYKSSSITTSDSLDSESKKSIIDDDDFCTKPCFSESDCDDIYRTAHRGPQVGRGSFGIVSSYVTKNRKLVAAKEIKLDDDDSERVGGNFKWVQEVYILRALDHPYIVKFYGISMENSRLVKIFMEYLPNGTIEHLVALFGPLHNNVLQKFTRQIIEGVAYLHRRGVVHRDLKGKNMMVDTLGNIRLIDFGCAIRLKDNSNTDSIEPVLRSLKGTLNWMAPEMANERGHGEKVDIWSVGCTLCEMATGKPPWSSEGNSWAVLKAITDETKQPSDLPERCPSTAREFFRLCVIRNPILRPSASDLQIHAFLVTKLANDHHESANEKVKANQQ